MFCTLFGTSSVWNTWWCSELWAEIRKALPNEQMWNTFPYPFCFCVHFIVRQGGFKVVHYYIFWQVIYGTEILRGKIQDVVKMGYYFSSCTSAAKLSRASNCLRVLGSMSSLWVAVVRQQWRWHRVHLILLWSLVCCLSLASESDSIFTFWFSSP